MLIYCLNEDFQDVKRDCDTIFDRNEEEVIDAFTYTIYFSK